MNIISFKREKKCLLNIYYTQTYISCTTSQPNEYQNSKLHIPTFICILIPLSDLRYSGCCLVSLVEGGSSWSVMATANLTVRSDTGLINSPPSFAMQPVVRLKQSCSYSIKIPGNLLTDCSVYRNTMVSLYYLIKDPLLKVGLLKHTEGTFKISRDTLCKKSPLRVGILNIVTFLYMAYRIE